MPEEQVRETKQEDKPSLQMRLLGRTGLKITEIGFGALGIGGGVAVAGRGMGYGHTDDAVSLEALSRAFDLGINFVDTADDYGRGLSERLVGRAIKVSPRRVHVATKVGVVRCDPERPKQDFSAAYIKTACERSLERLGVTIIDLYQLNQPPREVLENKEIWDTLRDLKDKSKIAHYGIVVSHPAEGLIAIKTGGVETIQLSYNLLAQAGVQELFEEAERHSVGIIACRPLAGGLLTGKYKPGHRFPEDDQRREFFPPAQLATLLARVEKFCFLASSGRTLAQAALKFCLAHPAVSVVIPGTKNPEQAVENAYTGDKADLTPDELKRASAI